MAQQCDVVIENFKVGALAKYGLDAASLRGLKPSLVYCSVTGFGQDGPQCQNAAYDFALQAMSGLISVTGETREPGGPAEGRFRWSIDDGGVRDGRHSPRTLRGAPRRGRAGSHRLRRDVAAAFLANQAMNHLVTGKTPQRGGNRHPNIQPQDVFAASDGHFVLAVGNDGQFARLCEVIGDASLAHAPRFATNAARVRANADLTALLSGAFASWKRDALVAALDAAGVPAAPINTIPQVFADPQLQHRGMLQHLPHPLAGSVPQVVSPIRLAGAPLRFDRAPPLLGQHTQEVLRELGLLAAGAS